MHQSRAFVLERRERREADQLVTLYTEEFGILRTIASGVRKAGAKLRGHLEPPAKTEVTLVTGKQNYRLTGAILIDSFARIRKFLERRRAAEAAAAVLLRIFFQERDPRIWGALEEFFGALDRESPLPARLCQQALFWFLIRALAILGYHASLDGMFSRMPRLRALFLKYESEDISRALDISLPPSALRVIGRALQKSFEAHTGQHFAFLTKVD
ncbi:MAG: recombination protein O N-terminal domain-containing protein [Candidatus Sungbacteria bacterium]|uniref:Recombination protein O N-terminal domain-containing protein n=1 Tax=Candidatus Sungiibacteriota bacterium TaxID=2750080 RepID=A0A931WPU1_9BACT|nr:recombination protein O N-terminal domain-containing protein [Candidatus Sungbacteria bacterium]